MHSYVLYYIIIGCLVDLIAHILTVRIIKFIQIIHGNLCVDNTLA